MICPFHTELHAKRRKALLDAMAAKGPDAVAIFPAAPVYVRNNDVDHDYRQDSDLFYLTGFDEPHSVLVLSARDRKATLFVRARDPERAVADDGHGFALDQAQITIFVVKNFHLHLLNGCY